MQLSFGEAGSSIVGRPRGPAGRSLDSDGGNLALILGCATDLLFELIRSFDLSLLPFPSLGNSLVLFQSARRTIDEKLTAPKLSVVK